MGGTEVAIAIFFALTSGGVAYVVGVPEPLPFVAAFVGLVLGLLYGAWRTR